MIVKIFNALQKNIFEFFNLVHSILIHRLKHNIKSENL